MVTPLQGKPFCLPVKRSDTVASLKAKIKDRTGIPEDEQRLICCGKQMENKTNNGKTTTLADYKVKNMSNIQIVLRMLGGFAK